MSQFVLFTLLIKSHHFIKYRRRYFRFLFIFFLSITLLFSFHQVFKNQQDQSSNYLLFSPAVSSQIIVSAAASLSETLTEIKVLYTQQQPEIKLTYNFGSSGSLQQQIEQGAPIDVFISASPQQMDALEEKGLLLPGTRKNLLTNRLVLVVPKGEKKITGFEDLTRNTIRKIAMGEPESVPAGKYAKEVLTSMNLFNSLQSKLVYAKDVRQVLSYVETGNVDAGIVYKTDAKLSTQVDIIATAPIDSHSPIIYPIAVLKESKNLEAALAFVTFISGNTIKTVFEQLGFRETN